MCSIKRPTRCFQGSAPLIEAKPGRPSSALFTWIEEQPPGSTSLAQTQRATTVGGLAEARAMR
jgi:predicted unusual protein kinase regulating ubiquinone biosynthesis (AarF/ABC1/UbiB family)